MDLNLYLSEFLGTLVLVLLGDGIVAGVSLAKSKSKDAGWVAITLAWGLAVTIGIFVSNPSGAHINPAVTIGMATIGNLSWALVPGYIIAQMLGAMAGAVLVWIAYMPHWKATEDQGAILGTFATGPAIRDLKSNFVTEAIGTAMLTFGILAMAQFTAAPGFAPFQVGALIVVLGLALGGPTGYALNPARDLGPRIMHAILPIANKGDSDWEYSWVPVLGPIVGGTLGCLLFKAVAFIYTIG